MAVRSRGPVPVGAALTGVAAEAVRENARLAALDGAVLSAAVVDTSRWELVHFTLFAHDAPDESEGDVFEVLHVSAPGRDRLPRGRQW